MITKPIPDYETLDGREKRLHEWIEKQMEKGREMSNCLEVLKKIPPITDIANIQWRGGVNKEERKHIIVVIILLARNANIYCQNVHILSNKEARIALTYAFFFLCRRGGCFGVTGTFGSSSLSSSISKFSLSKRS